MPFDKRKNLLFALQRKTRLMVLIMPVRRAAGHDLLTARSPDNTKMTPIVGLRSILLSVLLLGLSLRR